MDGTGEHYAKWNKPDDEGQIPYDLTFNWNIINGKTFNKSGSNIHLPKEHPVFHLFKKIITIGKYTS